MCLRSTDLVDALEHPDELVILQRMLTLYEAHRRTIPNETCDRDPDVSSQGEQSWPYKSDLLSLTEKQKLATQLVREVREEQPEWCVE